ncbi:NAD(+)/NADH kinase [Candidatus Rhabdochlamydia porcellionis]|jgi:NAD+ kinase|uniref:NAD kinase n=1 Tax=Candidatus Rhabdochlamydia porcellionis TaxID=225148 RepID=A0ABX8YZD1_9BACT|nr:NAD(+)/NADH kinase [Candidatus Rhabdochlamydia porcellionis]QZA58720.1 NAD kinase [Candidatus Rhabdochlamydia porcellionis]
MIIALFPNIHKQLSKDLAIDIREFLNSQNITVVAEDEKAQIIGAIPFSEIDLTTISFMISMGGDGSILKLVHKYTHLDIPVLGINLGHLGFMADVPISDLYPSLQDLIKGSFQVHKRVVIEGKASHKECFAVNDIVIHRGSNRCLVKIAIHIDGIYLNTFEADGIIIATPNGSTAYSLSAGGPIISPDLEALVLTPICPHTISNCPIVLAANQKIQIEYLSKYAPIEIHADGLNYYELKKSEIFEITRSKKNFKLISLPRRDYFSTLRTKLGWSGKLR